jgi:hypothetical protein
MMVELAEDAAIREESAWEEYVSDPMIADSREQTAL